MNRGRRILSLGACLLPPLCILSANAQEVTYRVHVRPILEARCMACHGVDSPEYPEFKEYPSRYLSAQKRAENGYL